MLSDTNRKILIDIALQSISNGLHHGIPVTPQTDRYNEDLKAQGACFVTLHSDNNLRGCIGSLKAFRPLINDVTENAYAAAFRDPRFQPLEESELSHLNLEISVLSKPVTLTVNSEKELLEMIQPGIDGLILEEGGKRGTFLPSVWQSLPEPDRFLEQLKIKAGLPVHYWSDTLKFRRYRTESFSSPAT